MIWTTTARPTSTARNRPRSGPGRMVGSRCRARPQRVHCPPSAVTSSTGLRSSGSGCKATPLRTPSCVRRRSATSAQRPPCHSASLVHRGAIMYTQRCIRKGATWGNVQAPSAFRGNEHRLDRCSPPKNDTCRRMLKLPVVARPRSSADARC
jgi:hypothetical protein